MQRTDSVLGRSVQRVAGSSFFARYGTRFAPAMDRFVHRVTGGRVMPSGGMVPMLMLTATGAKSGQQRTTPLATFPLDDVWYVVGSNYGRESHPAWSANLIAHPDASISFEGSDVEVTAHLLDAEEKAAVWPLLTTVWPLYDTYTERSGRDLRVFRLTPRG